MTLTGHVGSWLSRRENLVPIHAAGWADRLGRIVHVRRTRGGVGRPAKDDHEVVDRRGFREQVGGYYRYLHRAVPPRM